MDFGDSYCALDLTLMCQPFTLLNKYGLGCEGHEVALDDEVGILLAEEEWWSLVTEILGAGISVLKGHGSG